MSQKELMLLKEEEKALMTLHTKLSDQLNRLKVEELALISMMRLQNRSASSTLSAQSGITEVSGTRQTPDKIQDELFQLEGKYQEALDLSVMGQAMMSDDVEEEEEEDSEPETVTDQLSAFLNELSAKQKYQ